MVKDHDEPLEVYVSRKNELETKMFKESLKNGRLNNYGDIVKQSDVGQSAKEEPKVQKKLTASDIAFEAVLALDTNGISKEEFLVALKEQLELIEENIQLDEVA